MSAPHQGFAEFHSFRRGWEDGCVARVERLPEAGGIYAQEYRNGYADGRKALLAMAKKAMKRTGYSPNPLRNDKHTEN